MTTTKITAPYGTWKSPITADFIVAGTINFDMVATDGEDIYWIESRPQEGGRYVIVKRSTDGKIEDITPADFYASTKAHEYGGGAYTVKNGVVYFCNYKDQRLYRQNKNSTPTPITPVPQIAAGLRFADMIVDEKRNRLIAVCEDHTTGAKEAVNSLVAIDLAKVSSNSPGEARDAKNPTSAIHAASATNPTQSNSKLLTAMAQGHDFYSSPRLSPDGSKLAWLSWDHPNMPWDSTQLNIAEIAADGTLSNSQIIAGKNTNKIAENKIDSGKEESVFQPEWLDNDQLLFVSDRSDWWNLYLYNCQTKKTEAVYPMQAEFGLGQWIFGLSTYVIESPTSIVCAYNQNALWQLARIDLKEKTFSKIKCDYTDIYYFRRAGNKLVFRGASPERLPAIVMIDLKTEEAEELKSSQGINQDHKCDPNSSQLEASVPRGVSEDFPTGMIAKPQTIEFPTSNGLTAYALYYPPCNENYAGPENEAPPLLVKSHGGPTSSLSSGLNLSIQYWTSRGFAVVDVNYGGSTGYGRKYRERLYGQWGIVDVDDCTNAALYLANKGLVDPKRLLISGRSASGFTVLCALTFKKVFRAGASYYGISDLFAICEDTHKFESRMSDELIAPYPEGKDIYDTRSPINHTDKINCPIIFLQGLDDKIVPPNQTEAMVEALRKKKLPVACIMFEGEGHGFRKAATIKKALESELYFYARILGFTPADQIEPVVIENL